MGALPKRKFPDTSQGPMLQAGLSKEGTLACYVDSLCTVPVECLIEGISPSVFESRH